jgi:hypothetical protein
MHPFSPDTSACSTRCVSQDASLSLLMLWLCSTQCFSPATSDRRCVPRDASPRSRCISPTPRNASLCPNALPMKSPEHASHAILLDIRNDLSCALTFSRPLSRVYTCPVVAITRITMLPVAYGRLRLLVVTCSHQAVTHLHVSRRVGHGNRTCHYAHCCYHLLSVACGRFRSLVVTCSRFR